MLKRGRLLILPVALCLLWAGAAAARGGGGCLDAGTPVLAPNGTHAMGALAPDDEVVRLQNGKPVAGHVQAVFTVYPDAALEVRLDGHVVRCTATHLFETGPGRFVEAERLRAGDMVDIWDGARVRPAQVESIRCVATNAAFRDLLVDSGGTFIANGIVTHNKGCFLPDTPILNADGRETEISRVQPGDELLAFTPEGKVVTARVDNVLQHEETGYLEIETEHVILRVTEEHPFYVGKGAFQTACTLRTGDTVYAYDGKGLASQRVCSIKRAAEAVTVYNLQTDAPHTFFASGIAVHNKGGGGGGGGFHGGGTFGGGYSGIGAGYVGGATASQGGARFMMLVTVVVLVLILASVLSNSKGRRKDMDLDFIYSKSAVTPKVDKTRKLLEFIAKTDADFDADKLQTTARDVFVKLQECWESREYAPMQSLLMPYLYGQHCKQIAGMKAQHEINKIADLKVLSVQIVNVRYTNDASHREFTALITASACDHYVDDRTGKFRRGDTSAARFQEFWTFQRQGNAWLLRDVEQSRESSTLKEENFFEPFTDGNVSQLYGGMASKTGEAGPWVESGVATKESRIERLLMFLVKTDGPIWDRTSMLERVRAVFLSVMAARQSGQPRNVRMEDFFPETGKALVDDLERKQSEGLSEEYRNLCIRKVDLVLVRNYSDNTKDEFVARVSAHAQRVVMRHGQVVSKDADVVPFMQYWTFGRQGDQWKLKAVLPPAEGEKALGMENVDEGTSPEQLQWYYRQTRAN